MEFVNRWGEPVGVPELRWPRKKSTPEESGSGKKIRQLASYTRTHFIWAPYFIDFGLFFIAMTVARPGFIGNPRDLLLDQGSQSGVLWSKNLTTLMVGRGRKASSVGPGRLLP